MDCRFLYQTTFWGDVSCHYNLPKVVRSPGWPCSSCFRFQLSRLLETFNPTYRTSVISPPTVSNLRNCEQKNGDYTLCCCVKLIGEFQHDQVKELEVSTFSQNITKSYNIRKMSHKTIIRHLQSSWFPLSGGSSACSFKARVNMGVSQNEVPRPGSLPQGSVSKVCFGGLFRQSRTSQPYLKLVTPKNTNPYVF